MASRRFLSRLRLGRVTSRCPTYPFGPPSSATGRREDKAKVWVAGLFPVPATHEEPVCAGETGAVGRDARQSAPLTRWVAGASEFKVDRTTASTRSCPMWSSRVLGGSSRLLSGGYLKNMPSGPRRDEREYSHAACQSRRRMTLRRDDNGRAGGAKCVV